MAEPESDSSELQILVDIHRSIAPLIVKRIFDDLNATENLTLAVFNHLSNFKYEIGNIPLYLEKRGDITPWDYRSLLNLLEGMIDEVALPTTSANNSPNTKGSRSSLRIADQETTGKSFGTEYPKLMALMNKAKEQSYSVDLSTLLNIPRTSKKSGEAEKVITEFNNTNLARFNATVQPDVTEISPVSPTHLERSDKPKRQARRESAKRAQECLSDLWSALREKSKCGSDHVAKLQIRYPEASDYTQHRVFMSKCSGLSQWQEIKCKIIDRFVSIHPRTIPINHNDRNPNVRLENPRLKEIHNVCKTIHGSLTKKQTLEISVYERCLLRDPGAARLAKCPPPTLALHDLLSTDGDILRRYYKVVLALNLSYALLRAYHVGIQDEWTTRDIFFLFDPSNNRVIEAYNPCLTHCIFQQEGPRNAELTGSRKFPLLIALGKILLEVALGRPVSDSELLCRPDVGLLTIISDPDVEFELMENVGPSYVKAMNRCLEANLDDDIDDEEGVEDCDELDEEVQCRDVLLDVIEHLENARQNDYPTLSNHQIFPQKNPNHPLELTVANYTRIQSTPERSSYAEDFLQRAEQFYDSKIACIQIGPRIRIAILDTGVDVNNPFFRGVRQRRVKKDSPFKGYKSFVGNLETDTFGHGTNVAASLLRIAPEADLYIAKISQNEEHAGTDQIVEAFKWARSCDVHIISMSFGLSEDNAAIELAIEKAENHGIIFFAAASNYGGNTRRAFPARMDRVLCIHASDGYGNKSGQDPAPIGDRVNLSTLGVAIESVWESGVYLSGTSYSTPIAAGIAANILRYVQTCSELTEKYRLKAFRLVGMRNILKAMSVDIDNYHYIAPWRRMWDPDSTDEDVTLKIKQALKDD
ncbi:hypothetical protein QQS21_002506 [Conoideocrella luteorostrata]|uniref:Peptidase S8/S53 domain-containing protein n=1 Tax=Conoideocrella luteorostrata TaxID=1105319 RepID=A0AAJ0G164_9HYPO|nr:hypothetical protein QQS21_002506 [Conoideocrella luteorostrata]